MQEATAVSLKFARKISLALTRAKTGARPRVTNDLRSAPR